MAFLVTRGSMAGTSTATTDLDELLVGATTTPGCSTDAAARKAETAKGAPSPLRTARYSSTRRKLCCATVLVSRYDLILLESLQVLVDETHGSWMETPVPTRNEDVR